MATLQLIWDSQHTYDLWSWSIGNVHQTARIIRRIKNRVYSAHVGPRGMEPTQMIIIKTGRGEGEMAQLNREAELYDNELRYLQGTVVPKTFGFFRGKVDGVDLACLLLEYCSGPPLVNPGEFNRQIMLAACQVHRSGLIHGDLLSGRHFLRMGNGVRIIDFSSAVRHGCHNGIPTLLHSRGCETPQCSELVALERTYGMMIDKPSARQATLVDQRFW